MIATNIVWIAAGAGIVLGLAQWFRRRRAGAWNASLGFVSRQWIEEHRLAETADHA
ncbi:MAG TPA: hypothetical protein VN628_14140 [Vicinamibacterales bacterium]|nr:hypothetical protein [Vicinamibacterales bacterium]